MTKPEPGWPPTARSWTVVGVLLIAYVFAFIDRQILALMIDPIKADLGLSDTEISLLHGLAFALLYTVFGLPIGRMVDSGDRRRIAGLGITLWSIMTALCGMAYSFWTLFLARVGVGIGEATLTPAAYSLIADSFPPERRGRAFAVYSLGITAGGGLAWIVGGQVYDLLARIGPMSIGGIGPFAPWQLTFMVVGLPGLAAAAAVFAIREPARHDTSGKQHYSWRDAMAFVWHRRRLYAPLFLGFGLLSLCSYSFVWLPALFSRRFGWTPGEYGLFAGWIVIVAGSAGILAAGWLVDLRARRGHADAALQVLIGFSAASVVTTALVPLGNDPMLVIGMLAVAIFFQMAPFGLAPAVIQATTPNALRGQISAIYLFIMNLLGLGLGPTSVALVTDFGFADEQRIGDSIAIVCGVLGPLALLLIWSIRNAFSAALARAA